MTQSRTPPTKPSIPVPRRAPSDSPPAAEDIPRGEFIDVVSHKPVEPGRLQVFPVPEEFLSKVKARASKSPQLRPDDTKDTVPRGLPQQRASEPTPASATAPIASPQRMSPAPGEKTQSSQRRARAGATKQSPSTLTRWALTGKIPGRVKVASGAVIGALLVLLIWENWTPDDSDSETDMSGDPTTAASAAVPLLDAPSVTESAAATLRESPATAQQPAAAEVPGDDRPKLEPAERSAPPVIADAPKPVASQVAAARPDAVDSASVAKNASSSAVPPHTATVVAATSAKPKLIPLFEPR